MTGAPGGGGARGTGRGAAVDGCVRLRCPGRPRLELRPGQQLRIGRHPANDLVLDGPDVSRFHALIEWDLAEDRPHVRDLGSSNGTLVNGVPVERRHLTAGDRIGVGARELVVEVRAPGPDPDRAALLPEDDGRVTAWAGTFHGDESRGAVRDRGALERLLLVLEQEARTGTLELRAADGARAAITFCRGRVVLARAGGREGMQVLCELLGLARATWRFSGELLLPSVPLDASIAELLRAGLPATHKFSR